MVRLSLVVLYLLFDQMLYLLLERAEETLATGLEVIEEGAAVQEVGEDLVVLLEENTVDLSLGEGLHEGVLPLLHSQTLLHRPHPLLLLCLLAFFLQFRHLLL